MRKGHLIISLDFELLWGVRDQRNVNSYGRSIENVWRVIPDLLELFKKYEIKATFAVVGFLFLDNRDELLLSLPGNIPTYHDGNLSPYENYLTLLNSNLDKYHFAPALIKALKDSDHEVGSHTLSHYYCLEEGQTEEQFKEDLLKFIEITKVKGYQTSTIIFPRNQYGSKYLDICAELGMTAYRGNENNWAFMNINSTIGRTAQRTVRFFDRYINLTGHHCYDINQVNTTTSNITNIPSSRFLAPVNTRLKAFEHMRLKRITDSMRHAAQNGLTYHLWWHPHNFGNNTEDNLSFLEKILNCYQDLNVKYQFQNKTMSQLQCEFKNNGERRYTENYA